MQVLPMNRSNTAFRSIVINDDICRFSDKQKKAADDIVELMQKRDFYLGNSAEKYYESKGYNFSVAPSAFDDRVIIDAHQKVGKKEEHFSIGIFDNKNVRFRTSDIEYGIWHHDITKNQERISNNICKLLFASLVIGASALGYLIVDAFTNKKVINENLIENVVKPVTHSVDSINMLKHIK